MKLFIVRKKPERHPIVKVVGDATAYLESLNERMEKEAAAGDLAAVLDTYEQFRRGREAIDWVLDSAR